VAELSGIFVVAEVAGPLRQRIESIQREHDPRLIALWPPHVTLIGSSGAGPIVASTSVRELREAFEPITSQTPALELRFGAPYRFPDRDIVVLPLDPHGALRELHERLKMAGVRMHTARYPFTPHCTLTMYPPLSRVRERRLTSLRFDEVLVIDHLRVILTRAPQPVVPLLDLPLGASARSGS
jgi:2'-5' RNA ligase